MSNLLIVNWLFNYKNVKINVRFEWFEVLKASTTTSTIPSTSTGPSISTINLPPISSYLSPSINIKKKLDIAMSNFKSLKKYRKKLDISMSNLKLLKKYRKK